MWIDPQWNDRYNRGLVMTENQLGKRILDLAFKIHTELGPGLLETVYEVVLAYELRRIGMTVERQKPVPSPIGAYNSMKGFVQI